MWSRGGMAGWSSNGAGRGGGGAPDLNRGESSRRRHAGARPPRLYFPPYSAPACTRPAPRAPAACGCHSAAPPPRPSTPPGLRFPPRPPPMWLSLHHPRPLDYRAGAYSHLLHPRDASSGRGPSPPPYTPSAEYSFPDTPASGPGPVPAPAARPSPC